MRCLLRSPFAAGAPLSLITFHYALYHAIPLPEGVIAYDPGIEQFDMEDMKAFVEAWRAQGLARVSLDGAIAADGL